MNTAFGIAPRRGATDPQWDRLRKELAQTWDWQQRVRILGVKKAGATTYDVRILASRATTSVTVQVQSDITGGRDYNASTSISSTRYDLRANRQLDVEVTVNGVDDYYVFVVPEFREPDGTFLKFDGADGEDHMAFACMEA